MCLCQRNVLLFLILLSMARGGVGSRDIRGVDQDDNGNGGNGDSDNGNDDGNGNDGDNGDENGNGDDGDDGGGNESDESDQTAQQTASTIVKDGQRLKIECKIPSKVHLDMVKWFKQDESRKFFIGRVNSEGEQHLGSKWDHRNISIDLNVQDRLSTLIVDQLDYRTDSGVYSCVIVGGGEGRRGDEVRFNFSVTVSEREESDEETSPTSPPTVTMTIKSTLYSVSTNTTVTSSKFTMTLPRSAGQTSGPKLGNSALVGVVCGTVSGAVILVIIAVIVLDRMGKTPQWCRKQANTSLGSTCKKYDIKTNAVYEDTHSVYDDPDTQYNDRQNATNYDHSDTEYCDIHDKVETPTEYFLIEENYAKYSKVTSPSEKQLMESYDRLAVSGKMTPNKVAADSDGKNYSLLGNDNDTHAYSLVTKLDNPTAAYSVVEENDLYNSNPTIEKQPIENYDRLAFDGNSMTSLKMTADSTSYSLLENHNEPQAYSLVEQVHNPSEVLETTDNGQRNSNPRPENQQIENYDRLAFAGNSMTFHKMAADSGVSYSLLANENEARANSVAGQLDNPTEVLDKI